MKITVVVEIEGTGAHGVTVDADDELLTLAQAADRLGITVGALRTWVTRHPEYKPSSDRWTVDEIERVRERREAGS